MDIRIVSKADCPFCLMTKRWLEEHGFEYEEQLMDNEEERLAFYQSLNDLEETIGKSSSLVINPTTIINIICTKSCS